MTRKEERTQREEDIQSLPLEIIIASARGNPKHHLALHQRKFDCALRRVAKDPPTLGHDQNKKNSQTFYCLREPKSVHKVCTPEANVTEIMCETPIQSRSLRPRTVAGGVKVHRTSDI